MANGGTTGLWCGCQSAGSPAAEPSAGDDEYGADFLDWEERGVWYTPPDADIDVEGVQFLNPDLEPLVPYQQLPPHPQGCTHEASHAQGLHGLTPAAAVSRQQTVLQGHVPSSFLFNLHVYTTPPRVPIG